MLLGVKLYLFVLLMCVSLIANDVNHGFMCLLAIYIFSRDNWSDPCLLEKLSFCYRIIIVIYVF